MRQPQVHSDPWEARKGYDDLALNSYMSNTGYDYMETPYRTLPCRRNTAPTIVPQPAAVVGLDDLYPPKPSIRVMAQYSPRSARVNYCTLPHSRPIPTSTNGNSSKVDEYPAYTLPLPPKPPRMFASTMASLEQQLTEKEAISDWGNDTGHAEVMPRIDHTDEFGTVV